MTRATASHVASESDCESEQAIQHLAVRPGVIPRSKIGIPSESIASNFTSGILYPWTGLGKMVRTGTYWSVPVQVGTGQYKISQLVHTHLEPWVM